MKLCRLVVFAAVTIAVAASCSKQATPASRTSMPPDVIAIISVPSYDEALLELVSWTESVAPELGKELLAAVNDGTDELALDRDAIDWTRPVHFVLVAPPAGTDEPRLVIVAGVRDAAAVAKLVDAERDVTIEASWAAVGRPAVVARTAPWALGTLAVAAPPASPTLTVFPRAIRARWHAEIAADLDPGDSAARSFGRDVILGLFDQTARLDATFTFEGDVLTANLALTPRAESTLAELFAAQQPATFDMLAMLPLDQPLSVMGAHLTLGRSSPAIRALAKKLVTDTHATWGPRGAALLDTLWSSSTGEYAGVNDVASDGAVNIIGLSDGERARRELDALARAATEQELPESRVAVEARTHDGVRYSVATMTSNQGPVLVTGSWAAWDGVLAVILSDLGGATLRGVIDRSRRKPPLPASLAGIVADARARRDSFLLTIDPFAGQRPPAIIAFGVREGAGHLWLQLSAAQMSAMRQLTGAAD